MIRSGIVMVLMAAGSMAMARNLVCDFNGGSQVIMKYKEISSLLKHDSSEVYHHVDADVVKASEADCKTAGNDLEKLRNVSNQQRTVCEDSCALRAPQFYKKSAKTSEDARLECVNVCSRTYSDQFLYLQGLEDGVKVYADSKRMPSAKRKPASLPTPAIVKDVVNDSFATDGQTPATEKPARKKKKKKKDKVEEAAPTP